MKGAGSVLRGGPQRFSGKVQGSRIPRRYRRLYGPQNEAMLILVLFLLLVIILLYFS